MQQRERRALMRYEKIAFCPAPASAEGVASRISFFLAVKARKRQEGINTQCT